jgi:hypothetical protein
MQSQRSCKGQVIAAHTLAIALSTIGAGVNSPWAASPAKSAPMTISQAEEPSTESQSSTEPTTPTTAAPTTEPSASPPPPDGLEILGVQSGQPESIPEAPHETPTQPGEGPTVGSPQ